MRCTWLILSMSPASASASAPAEGSTMLVGCGKNSLRCDCWSDLLAWWFQSLSRSGHKLKMWRSAWFSKLVGIVDVDSNFGVSTH